MCNFFFKKKKKRCSQFQIQLFEVSRSPNSGSILHKCKTELLNKIEQHSHMCIIVMLKSLIINKRFWFTHCKLPFLLTDNFAGFESLQIWWFKNWSQKCHACLHSFFCPLFLFLLFSLFLIGIMVSKCYTYLLYK